MPLASSSALPLSPSASACENGVPELPGLTNTGLSQNLLRNEGRMKIDFTHAMTPEDVAAGILRALRRNRAETVIGWEARWMLLANRFFPRLVDRLIARKVRQLYAMV